MTSYGQTTDQSPHLLLTPQRLRRLKRDRERQTVRWVNFESRVESVPDSPERGFELALYYAITGDQPRGREAIEWALHASDHRQVALVLAWCNPLLSDAQRKTLAGRVGTFFINGPIQRFMMARDVLFASIAAGKPISAYTEEQRKPFIDELQRGAFADPGQLYAASEFLMAYRTAQHVDLREDAPRFFSDLPTEFLLSLKPDKVEHSDWMTHIAALALVAVDPNLQSSQFLQGWAMESRQMVRDGPGVAYELLWADPYLPGVGYQNLDPWAYDPDTGRLFARTDWSAQSCWIGVSKTGVDEQDCPKDWQHATAKFGHLLLVPLTAQCAELPGRPGNDVAILWKLPPNQPVTFTAEKQQHAASADPSGMLRLGSNITGKVCLPQQGDR
ncbi:MAG TPA: hypothetical protein VH601_00250 [Bryobacteraceae bacterium]|jgi:hypothetical protein